MKIWDPTLDFKLLTHLTIGVVLELIGECL